MVEFTGISWCDSTANPVIGCEKVSAGCSHCYAERSAPARQLRARGIETWGPQAVRHETKGFEKAMLAFNRLPWICDSCGKATDEPEHGHHWTPGPAAKSVVCGGASFHRRRVFVNSLSDWLDPRWPVATLARTLDVWRRCPDIEIITCTKRPELWPERVEGVLKWLEAADCKWPQDGCSSLPLRNWLADWSVLRKAPANITVLTTVENQEQADIRIPYLLKIPAARRGLSLEPLLGPVDLSRWIAWHQIGHKIGHNGQPLMTQGQDIRWLIIGGESGAKARPCNVEWIRSLVQQGQAAGVPVFVKQLGTNVRTGEFTPDGWPVGTYLDGHTPSALARVRLRNSKGADPSEWPEDLRMQQWPETI